MPVSHISAHHFPNKSNPALPACLRNSCYAVFSRDSSWSKDNLLPGPPGCAAGGSHFYFFFFPFPWFPELPECPEFHCIWDVYEAQAVLDSTLNLDIKTVEFFLFFSFLLNRSLCLRISFLLPGEVIIFLLYSPDLILEQIWGTL